MTDEEAKREEARKALEGAEWSAKREAAEAARLAEEKIAVLETKLAGIKQEKEKLELAWIDLDDQKKTIRVVLNPLLEEEKKLETEESALETEEASTGVPESRHAVEIKRWPIQAKRKEIEEKKWTEEQKILALDQTIEANTKKYRALLEEEEKTQTEVDKLNNAREREQA